MTEPEVIELSPAEATMLRALGDPESTDLDYARASLVVQSEILGELRSLRMQLEPVAELLPDLLPRLKTLAGAGAIMGKLARRG